MMADFLTIEDIQSAISDLPFDKDPRFTGLKEVLSPYIPVGSHLYENDKYMVFFGDGNECGFAYEKLDWINKPFAIKPPAIDEKWRHKRVWEKGF